MNLVLFLLVQYDTRWALQYNVTCLSSKYSNNATKYQKFKRNLVVDIVKYNNIYYYSGCYYSVARHRVLFRVLYRAVTRYRHR